MTAWLLLLVPPALFAAAALAVERVGRSAPVPSRAQAIVVLGARLDAAGRPTPALEGRVDRALELYRAGVADTVVFSGGASRGGATEARAAFDYAVARGLPGSAALLEEQSVSTATNARECAQLLLPRGLREVALVTDGFHVLRASRDFARAGFLPRPAASRRVLTLQTRAWFSLREVVALARPRWWRG